MADPVNLDTSNATPQPVSVDTAQPGNPTPSPDTADNRAYKTWYGLGDVLQNSKDGLYNQYMQGYEQAIRTQASSALNATQDQQRIQGVIDAANKAGQTLSIEQMNALYDKPRVDPNSVIEDNFSQTFMDSIYKADASIGGIDLTNAMAVVPDVVQRDLDNGVSHMSNREYAQTRSEDMEDQANQQSWGGWTVDQAKMFVPFYTDFKLRGWLDNQSAFTGWLQGNNLYDQTRTLLRLPGPEFRQKLDEILDHLSNDNPTLARQYAAAVVGMSPTDIALGDINNIIDITSLPGLSAVGKKALTSVNAVRTAIKDGVAGGAVPRPNSATAAEAMGDAGTAAVRTTSDNLVHDISGTTGTAQNGLPNDPIERAKAILPTNYRLMRNEIETNPGPLSRELTARLTENITPDIVNTIADVSKVQRIDLSQATEATMGALKDTIRDRYPKLGDAIADIGDPIHNPISNNYNFPVRIVNRTAEQFSTQEAASRFADEVGILEHEIEGVPGARYYIPESAVKRPWERDSRLGEVIHSNGELRVFTDDGAQVATTLRPAPGMIPISVDEAGKVTFHPTLKTDAEVAQATVEQKGLGYHLLTWIPLNEGETVLKDMVKGLASHRSIASDEGINGWVNSIPGIGISKTSDNTLSPFETLQRKTATFSINRYHKALQDNMKFVEDVARGRIRIDPVTGKDVNQVWSYIKTLNPVNKINNRQIWQEFTRALDNGRSGDNIGRFFKNPAELNEFYQTNFQRSPTFREQQGYFAFVKAYEDDRVLRSVREYTNKVTQGAQQHQLTFIDAKGNKFPSGFFEGILQKELPHGEDPILLMHKGRPMVQLTSQLGSKYKDLADAVKSGQYQVVKLWNPELRQLQTIPGVGRNYISYVLADKFDSKALDWNQVNRLEGGHFAYDYRNYLKEAKVETTRVNNTTIRRYEGDRTFMPISNAAQGRQIGKVLNEVKRLLREGDTDGARNVFESGLPGAKGPAMEWKDFLAKTQDRIIDGKPVPATVDINEPYHVVPQGKSIIDLDNELKTRYGNQFKDGTKSASPARMWQVAYTQERDSEALNTLRVSGTKANPVYNMEPAKFLDPMTTLNRALNQVSSQSFMDDMKIAGIESWLREAEPYLKAPDINDIRSSPFWYFHNSSNEKAFLPGAPGQVVRNLLSNRFKTLQFLGVPSKYDVLMHELSQKISDGMSDWLGPKGADAAVVPQWLLGQTKSPVRILRSVAYHTKIGLFAVPQLLTQSQTYFTIAALAPRSAVSGTLGAMLHQWSRFAKSPEFINLLDDYATRLNIPGFHAWKPGEFKEAMQELDRRGFANVGDEYSTLDTQLRHKFVKSEWGSFLDLGTMFFKMAEQNVRYGAWYTAYKEYKALSPLVKTMGKADWDRVLDRADTMSGNMTRASASILQSGPLSLTGQFLTYQMHLSELFWGKRIEPLGSTVTQRNLARFRMYMTYATIFGLPGGIGLTGIPAGQAIREAAERNGYNVGDNWLSSMVMEGLPSYFLAWATGGGDAQKGNFYNFGDRVGAGGFNQLNEALDSNVSWWQLLGGASTSIGVNMWKDSTGWRRSMASMMTGKTGDEAFPMTIDDWVDLFKEVSSVSQTWKATTAIQYGKWMSKNENYQADVSKGNAIFMALSGLDLQRVGDNYTISKNHESDINDQKAALQLFVKETHRGITAANNNDWPSYKQYMTRAFGYLKSADYPLDKYPSAIAIAGEGWETRINSIREEFYIGPNVPESQRDLRYGAYQRFLKLQDKGQ